MTVAGEPWFVAKDVCNALSVGNVGQAVARLDSDEKADVILNDGRQNRLQTAVNEPGLYSLILGSRKPEARAFKRWITHEVIPSIRRNGMYATDTTQICASRSLAQILRIVRRFITFNYQICLLIGSLMTLISMSLNALMKWGLAFDRTFLTLRAAT